MKKTWATLTISMILVLAFSIVGAKFLLPLINTKTYSETTCLTDQITDSMDIYDIAKLYRDSRATVAITVQGHNNSDGYTYTSLGSGVCVASKGYETKNLDTNITASMGSYVVTNYHVIDMTQSSDFSNCKINLMTEEELTYPCQLLWSNKDLDVAVLYCDSTNLDYVRMQDRVIFCEEKQKLDYEPIFTIGTPLDLSYLNRLTIGEVASNNLMSEVTAEYIYPTSSGSYSNYPSLTSSSEILVMSNVYEDVVDITVGITNGNSGGGCFDENGVLVGLTTLGLSVDATGGNQMNGIVPIYPIIEIIDKLISNKEQSTNFSIYTLENLGVKGIDSNEAYYVTAFQEENNYSYYFIDGDFYNALSYSDEFAFDEEGYLILSNSSSNNFKNISNGSVITGCTINDGERIEIINRNDLIYALLQIDDGDQVVFSYKGTLGLSLNQTVQF